jgi:hypothetical protein
MDILGILIGFIAIMLLFSLLITALVHGAQAILNLRFKNLKVVLTQFFENMDFVEYEVTQAVLNHIENRFPSGLYATALPLNIPGNRLKLTSIGQQELMSIISNTRNVSIEEKEQLKNKVLDHFHTLEEIMSQRFKQWMHQISIILAFVICFVFQLNCFSLLNQLNHDSAFRQQSLYTADQLADKTLEQANSSDILQPHLMALEFDITPREWIDYYFSLKITTLSHWLGIIFSSILVSLGAPFWFNRLKDMASLRDNLSKAKS